MAVARLRAELPSLFVMSCEAGTAPPATAKSHEVTTDVRSTDGLWPGAGGCKYYSKYPERGVANHPTPA